MTSATPWTVGDDGGALPAGAGALRRVIRAFAASCEPGEVLQLAGHEGWADRRLEALAQMEAELRACGFERHRATSRIREWVYRPTPPSGGG